MIQRSELEYQVGGGSRQALRASPHNQLCRSSCLIQSSEVLVGRREPRVQCWQHWLDATDIRPRRYTCRNHVRYARCRSPGVFGQRPRTETARAKTRIYLNHTEEMHNCVCLSEALTDLPCPGLLKPVCPLIDSPDSKLTCVRRPSTCMGRHRTTSFGAHSCSLRTHEHGLGRPGFDLI